MPYSPIYCPTCSEVLDSHHYCEGCGIVYGVDYACVDCGLKLERQRAMETSVWFCQECDTIKSSGQVVRSLHLISGFN